MRYKSPALLLALLVLLVACQKSDDTIAPIRLVVPSWYAPDELPALGRVVDAWNAQHPQTPLKVKAAYGKRDSLLQKIMLSGKRGEYADIMLVRNEWLGRLAANEMIKPLEKTLTARILAETLPALQPAIAQGDVVWAMPFDADVLVNWRNESPNADALPLAFPAARAVNSAMAFLPWYFTRGGRLIRDNVLALDAEIAAATLSDLKQRAGEAQRLAAMEQADVFSCLASGVCAQTVGGSWERAMLAGKSKLGDAIRAYPLGGDDGVTLIGGWSFVVPEHPHPYAEKALIAFFAPDVQRAKLTQNALLPVRADLTGDPWFEQNPDGAAFRLALQNGRALPMHLGVLSALETIATMVAEVFLEAKQPAEAATEAARQIAQGSFSSPIKLVSTKSPGGSLRVTDPSGGKVLFTQQMLAGLPHTELGDLSVIALTALCGDCGIVNARVVAADGYVKTIASNRLSRAYLEPEHLRVVIARGGSETFTVRDVEEIVFITPTKVVALTVTANGERYNFSREELEKIRTTGVVYFAELVDLVGAKMKATVRLRAVDGYTRDIPWSAFVDGKLFVEGMRCEFAGLSSKDQIRDLTAIDF